MLAGKLWHLGGDTAKPASLGSLIWLQALPTDHSLRGAGGRGESEEQAED